jgi:tRNA threonylcarbamoyladenosine biosynthesis protein TsaB
MRILAFDTSSPVSAVAVVDAGRVLAQDDSPEQGRHGEVLLPRIQRQLELAGVALAAIELIAVGQGPGSFTGLRIGLATAKGLALASAIPLRGVCSLRVLARGIVDRGELVVVALDAGRGEVFGAAHRCLGGRLEPLLPPLRALPEELARRVAELSRGPAVLCGGGARRYMPEFAAVLGRGAVLAEAGHDLPRGRHVAQEAELCMRSEGVSDLATLEPTYLRGSDAKLPDEPLVLD